MKSLLVFTFFLLSIAGFSQKRQPLFDGKSLKGWHIFVKDNSVSPENFFYVKDGLIETIGVPVGYLRTKKQYSNSLCD